MLFFHKPLIETYYGYYDTLYYNKPLEGERREGVAYVRRDVGIFNKAYRLNSTKAIIYGHNHRNNYSVDYYGIKLCFGTKSSRAAYHDRDLIGGSVYVLKPDNTIQIERHYV